MVNFEINADKTILYLNAIQSRISDFTPMWNSVHNYMQGTIQKMFMDMGGDLGSGRTLRGVQWDYFKDQYKRKTDNVVVPAWGGVERLVFEGGFVRLGSWIGSNRPNYARTAKARKAKKGLVLGRLRRKGGTSNVRLKKGDSMMRSAGFMFNGLLLKTVATVRSLTMISAGNKKKLIYQNKLRPFQFFEVPKDVEHIRQLTIKHITKGQNNE